MIARLRKILVDAHSCLSPKSVIAIAIAYGTKLWTALTRFLNDVSLEIDNHFCERSLRAIAQGDETVCSPENLHRHRDVQN